MTDDLWDDPDDEERKAREEIAEEDRLNRERNFHLHALADRLATRMAAIPGVERIAIIGSVARPPTTTLPRPRRLRRFGVKVVRECKDLDLAVWITDADCLRPCSSRATGRPRSTSISPGTVWPRTWWRCS